MTTAHYSLIQQVSRFERRLWAWWLMCRVSLFIFGNRTYLVLQSCWATLSVMNWRWVIDMTVRFESLWMLYMCLHQLSSLSWIIILWWKCTKIRDCSVREVLFGASTMRMFTCHVHRLLLCKHVKLVSRGGNSTFLSGCRRVFISYIATATRSCALSGGAVLLVAVRVHMFTRLYISSSTDRWLLFQRTRCRLWRTMCLYWLISVGWDNLWTWRAWSIWNSVWRCQAHHSLIFGCYWVRSQWHRLFEIVKWCLVR